MNHKNINRFTLTNERILKLLFLDINECSDDELICGMTGQCQNTPGSYICQCPQGQYWSDETRTCGGETLLV